MIKKVGKEDCSCNDVWMIHDARASLFYSWIVIAMFIVYTFVVYLSSFFITLPLARNGRDKIHR